MLIRSLVQVVRGFAMGTADVVPGVSGGTVALVLGVYQRLIASIRAGARSLGSILRGDPRGFLQRLAEVDWAFLIPLLVGIGLAVVTLAHSIEHLLDTQPVRMAAVFFGLVAGSAIVAARLLRGWDPPRVAIALATAAVAFVVLGFRSGPVDDPSMLIFLAAGMLAICAMILPGVSGSFLLLMIGMYDNVLGAVTDREVALLAVFLVGCVVGLALFSQVLHWGLVNHERTVLAVLVGLLVGSLRVLWPWPEGTDGASLGLPEADVAVPVLLMAGAAAVVLGITAIGERVRSRDDADLSAELRSDPA